MTTQAAKQLPEVPGAEQREAYQNKVKAELDKLNAQIDEFRAKAEQAKADAAVNYHSTVEELVTRRDALQKKWEELQSASESAWQDIQKGLESAWNDLTQALDNAARQFN